MKYLKTHPMGMFFVILAAACSANPAPVPTNVGPQSWIDAPLNESVLAPAPFTVVTHSTDPFEIVQVELSVNGAPVGSVPNADISNMMITTRLTWSPPTPGDYVLKVRAQNTAGVWGEYAQAIVTVQGTGPQPPQPPQVQPPPVVVPSATPATQQGAPTSSPPPAASITFYADATTLIQGQCTTIHWQVTNASQVTLDNATANATGSKQDCPNQTTTHTLRVISLDGPNLQRTLTINVAPPARTLTSTPTRTLPPPPLPVGCSGTPVISSFSASPSLIQLGGSSTLSWGTVTNTDSVEIDNGIGGVASPGTQSVSPNVTTVYVLTARCKGVTAIARTIVTVVQPPTPTLILRRLSSPTPTRTPIIVR